MTFTGFLTVNSRCDYVSCRCHIIWYLF